MDGAEEPRDPAARAFDAMRRISGGSGAGTTAQPRRRSRRRGPAGTWSGAGADDRDPQALSTIVSRVVDDQGWASDVHKGQVLGTWDRLVGETIAGHVRPISLNDGELVVVADSTAWATQFGLMARQAVQTINKVVGSDVVKVIKVRGPSTPSWKSGPRTVRGRGPRDTYG